MYTLKYLHLLMVKGRCVSLRALQAYEELKLYPYSYSNSALGRGKLSGSLSGPITSGKEQALPTE